MVSNEKSPSAKLMDGSKTAPINLKVTENFKIILRQNWDMQLYPKTAKRRRDPNDSTRLIPFKSETDFVTTILRKEFAKSHFKFDWDMELNNPDFRGEE